MEVRSLSKTRGPALWAGLVGAVLLSAPSAAGGENKPLWLAVGRPALVKALAPLARLRRQQGYQTLISTKPVAEALAAADRKPAMMLLLGDDQPGKEDQPWYLPARRMKLYRWRRSQPRLFASDAAWGDLDGDGTPDVPVGRIPARTPAQVELAVKKILAFEARQPTADDLRLPVWAGAPGYNPLVDALATNMLLGVIQANAPAWVQPWIITGNPNHPLCGWPPDQPGLFARQMTRGGALILLIGHAEPERFFAMDHGGRSIYFTASAAGKQLAGGGPAAPAVIFACDCGDFTRPTPCLAESLFFAPGGPVAAIAAVSESHPLMNSYSILSLLKALGGSEKRIGPLWLQAQRSAMRTRNFLAERILRNVEGKLEEEINLGKLRRDQALMYALLGDPATPLKLPQPLKVAVEYSPGGWRWRAARPAGAGGLQVGLRAGTPKRAALPGGAGASAPEKARAAFRACNAGLGFDPDGSPDAGAAWAGTVKTQGRLRLVATGAGRIYAAAVDLEMPTSRPAASERDREKTTR